MMIVEKIPEKQPLQFKKKTNTSLKLYFIRKTLIS